MAQIIMRMGLVLVVLFSCLPAEAELIIDTGQPTGINEFALGQDEEDNTGLGGRIYLGQTYDITRLEGWLRNYTTDAPKECFVVLYQDGTIIDSSGYNPGSPIAYYSVSVPEGGVAGWYGANVPSLRLAAGYYWLAFQVGQEYFSGTMPGGSPNPLSLEARTWSGIDGPWSTDLSPMNLGFRVYGDPVPAPAAIFLLGSGLLGLAGWRRLRRY